MTLNDMKIKYRAYPRILTMISEIEELQNWANIKEIEIVSTYEDLEKKLQNSTEINQKIIIEEKLTRLNAELSFVRTTFDEKFIMIQNKLLKEIKNI